MSDPSYKQMLARQAFTAKAKIRALQKASQGRPAPFQTLEDINARKEAFAKQVTDRQNQHIHS